MLTHDPETGRRLPRPVPLHLSPGGRGPNDLGPFATYCGRLTDNVRIWCTPELERTPGFLARIDRCRSCVAALSAESTPSQESGESA